MRLLGATGSHVGNVREANQDRVFFRGMVAALADGMGGHQGGERAAELAIGAFEDASNQLSEGDLIEVVMSANREVHGHAAHNGLPGMGTTLVAMTLHWDQTITVANVGDSRAYWLRGESMAQITEDHSFVEDLVRQGRLSPADAATHPQRNILTRAVGIGAEVEVDRFPIREPAVGDRFLLCSDGLFNELSEDEILEILIETPEPLQAAARLIDATLKTPCRDNVTVAVVDIVEDDDPRIEDHAIDLQDEEAEARVITAPVPVVSKSVLHDPMGGPDGSDGDLRQNASNGTGTLLLDEAAEELDQDDPELYLETKELEIVEDAPAAVEPRSKLVLGLGALLLVGMLATGGFFLAQNYARSGFFIAEDESGQLAVFEGREDGLFGLFEPERVLPSEELLDPTDEAAVAMIEDRFDSLEEAQEVLAWFEQRRLDAAADAAQAQATADDAAGSSSSSESGDGTNAPETNQRSNADSSEDSSQSSTSQTEG